MRLEKLKANAEAKGLAGWQRTELDDVSDSTSSDESVEYIDLSEFGSEGATEASSKTSLGNATPETRSRDSEAAGLLTRIASLRDRVERTLITITY